MTERLPEPGRDVLVRAHSGRHGVFHIVMVEWVTADGMSGEKPCWYPGGLPIENSVAWMEVPAYE